MLTQTGPCTVKICDWVGTCEEVVGKRTTFYSDVLKIKQQIIQQWKAKFLNWIFSWTTSPLSTVWRSLDINEEKKRIGKLVRIINLHGLLIT